MDLFDDWQELQTSVFNKQPIDKEKIMNSIQIESQDILGILDKRLSKKLYWGLSFILLSATLVLFSLNNTVLLLTTATLTAIFVALLVPVWLQLRLLHKQKDQSGGILARLHIYHRRITKVMQMENLLSLLFVPLAAVAGQTAGFYLGGKERTLEEIFTTSIFLQTALVMIILLTPLGVWMTNALNRKAFAPLLRQLEGHIRQLESLD